MKCIPDISCIITFHNEGLYALPTIKSIAACIEYAKKNGVTTKVIAVGDAIDDETKEILNKMGDYITDYEIYYTDYRDVGLARNYGINKALSPFIGIFDGDDLYSENYIYECVKACEKNKKAIYRQEYTIVFERYKNCWKTPILGKNFSIFQLLTANPYTSNCVAAREIFLEVPYQASQNGYGYEDWLWNCDTFAKKYQHLYVPGTFQFYRRKFEKSRLSEEAAKKVVIRHSTLFEKLNEINEENPFIKTSKPIKFTPNSLKSFIFRLGRKYLPLELKRLIKRTSLIDRLPARFPKDISESCRKMALIEPQLHPDIFWAPEYIYPTDDKVGKAFASMVNNLGKFDILYIVPWLKQGGADLQIINYANTMANSGYKVLVIATEDEESEQNINLNNVKFLEFGKITSKLFLDDKRYLLLRLILATNPKILQIINSFLGCETLFTYSRQLHEKIKIYVSFYCDEKLSDGTDTGNPAQWLLRLYNKVDGFISDNSILPEYWSNKYGVDIDQFTVLRSPTKPIKSDSLCVGPNILWASRMVHQKRIDLLFKIAKKLPEKDFLVYGNKLLSTNDDEEIITKLQKLNNIIMKGAYNGFDSLPCIDCFCFLYTGAWDGMPNVILEAAAHNLPIATPLTGGIGDFITKETGWPIHNLENIDEYIYAIKEIRNNPEEAKRRCKNARQRLLDFYSEDALKKALLSLYLLEW